jgi:ferredoxin
MLTWVKEPETSLSDHLVGAKCPRQPSPAAAGAWKRVRAVIRTVISIHEELCNGCGECVPSCEEGAIQIVHGKARLVSDILCDGLGACLGSCPQGAISIEEREAAPFDEAAAQRHVAELEKPVWQESELTHWPVQLRLLPAAAPALRGARLLVAADCVPVAYAGFHSDLLRGRAVVIACPKLDDKRGYVEKLAEMIRCNDLAEITVAHMEVPCCTGILRIVTEARELAGSDIPVDDLTIGIRGELMPRRDPVGGSTGLGSNETDYCQIKGVE